MNKDYHTVMVDGMIVTLAIDKRNSYAKVIGARQATAAEFASLVKLETSTANNVAAPVL